MRTLAYIYFFFLSAFTSVAFSTGQEKGGGIAIHTGNAYYLYDFFENGIQDRAELADRPYSDRWGIAPGLGNDLHMDLGVAQAISDKLYQVASKNTHFARLLYNEFFRTYSLRIVDTELVETRDLGSSPIIPRGSAKLYQVAVRDDFKRAVWINSLVWKQLPFPHQVGLIFHEAVYAVMAKYYGERTSSSSRNITAYIFSPGFAAETPQSMHDFLSSFLNDGIFLGFKNILSNEDAARYDVENDMTKIKTELYDHAVFFSKYGEIWTDQAQKFQRKWSEKCSVTHSSESSNFLSRIEFEMSHRKMSSYTWNMIGKFKWRMRGSGTWAWSKDVCSNEAQIFDDATMTLLSKRSARLKVLLDLFPSNSGQKSEMMSFLLSHDKDLHGLLKWLYFGSVAR